MLLRMFGTSGDESMIVCFIFGSCGWCLLFYAERRIAEEAVLEG